MAAGLEGLRRAACALRLADAAIGEIVGHLQQLEKLLSPTARAQRVSPRGGAGLQPRIDAAIRAIGKVVERTEIDGRPLLDGRWSATLQQVGTSDSRTVRIPSLTVSRLGNAGVGFLATIGSGEVNELRPARIMTVRAIVGSSLTTARRTHDELAVFSAEVLAPMTAAWEIAAENANAAASVTDDAEFASKTSRLTLLDALAGTSGRTVSPRVRSSFSKLKLDRAPDRVPPQVQ